jgi:hypothetical protein
MRFGRRRPRRARCRGEAMTTRPFSSSVSFVCNAALKNSTVSSNSALVPRVTTPVVSQVADAKCCDRIAPHAGALEK